MGHPHRVNIRAISGYDKIEVLSCGKNIWDEEWEKGNIDSSGQPVSSDSCIRSKNFIPIASNTTYGGSQFKANGIYEVFYYDINKNFISSYGGYFDVVHTITTLANAKYLKFRTTSAYGNTYNNDISINYLSSDDQYHAYNKTTDLSESLGQTVYGATWYLRTGILKSKEKANYIVIDGNANWGMQTNGNNKRFYATGIGTNINESSTNHICNMALIASGNNASQCYTVDDRFALYAANYGTVYLSGNIASDVTALKALLNTTPLQICYTVVDSAEKTIQLTPHEISLLKDYAYVSTNGTSISFSYHNGELASLGDVSQLGESFNGLGEYIGANNKGTDVDLSLYTSQSSSYQFPKDGYIVVYGGSATSGNIYVALLGNDNGNFGGIYMNITGTSQMQTTFVKKGMRAYLGSKTASASNLAVVYRPLV